MKQKRTDLEVLDCIRTLSPAIIRELEKKGTYHRYIVESAKLREMAAEAFAKTGTLTSPALILQNNVVTELGNQLLEEIQNLEFMQREF